MIDHIKNYWESQGATHGISHWASWGDNWMIALEIETIAQQINAGDAVIDIGCANGFSTFQQSKIHKLKSIVGVDFSENMIASAKSELSRFTPSCPIQFTIGDVRNLKFESESFDFAYTTRVIINLPTWSEQMRAIDECLRVVKKGGRLVLSEGFWEPLVKLNALRQICSLPPLVEHDFNRYLKLDKLRAYLEEKGLVYEVIDFSSIYYLGSRFVRELVTDPSAYEGFSNPINRIFYDIEREYSGGGFGIQQAVVINK
jgi:ubiquinone/menaquinone biosynthesis C-methylase UbiE